MRCIAKTTLMCRGRTTSKRPFRTPFRIACATRSGSISIRRWKLGRRSHDGCSANSAVDISPGSTTVVPMPRPANSALSDSLSETTANCLLSLSVAERRVKAVCQALQVRWESTLAFRRCLISEIKGNLDSLGLTFSQKAFQCHPIISQAEGLDRQEVESQPFLF